MKLNLQPINSQEITLEQEIDVDEKKVEALFQMLEEDEFPRNIEQGFIYQAEYFALLIKAIEIDDVDKVRRILYLTKEESVNLAQLFNHGEIGKWMYPGTVGPSLIERVPLRKTLLIVAAQYSAHKSLQLLLKHIKKNLTPVECAYFVATDGNIKNYHDNQTMLDIILNERELALKVSPFEDIKKSIDLIPCGLTCNTLLLANPAYNLNFDLIKYLVEEKDVDVNERHDEVDETNIAAIIGIEGTDDYDQLDPETQGKIRKIMAYMLEKGAFVHFGNEGFLYTLQRSGSEDLYQIVEPYKNAIDFAAYDPLDQIDLFNLQPRNHRSFLLEIKHLDRPIPPNGSDVYKKLLLMHGTESDFILAKTKFNVRENDLIFDAQDINRMINYVLNELNKLSHPELLVKNIRHFSINLPKASHDEFLKLILKAGSDDDLNHTLNTLKITPSEQWLTANDTFKLCERVQQALLLKAKINEIGKWDLVAQQPAFKSVERYCTFFARTGNIPARGSARCGINITALGVFKDCLLDSGLLSLRETINFMQVSKSYYGDIETPTPETSVINNP